jgi:hypothetical protein
MDSVYAGAGWTMSESTPPSHGGVPPEAWLEHDRPTAARMYDYLLGGSRHFQADRDTVERVLIDVPHLRHDAWANRGFLRRAVRYMIQVHGIRQFLDLGSGIPTVGNVQYARTPTPGVARDREQIAALFGDMPLVEPELVPVSQWRPDEPPPGGAGYRCRVLGGVGVIRPPE